MIEPMPIDVIEQIRDTASKRQQEQVAKSNASFFLLLLVSSITIGTMYIHYQNQIDALKKAK